MEKLSGSKFDNPEKGREWHTAFYYMAEHVKALTNGKVNYKKFYARVGVEGRFVNHDKAVIRKSLAGKLSHLMHSKGYVTDMHTCYLENAQVFQEAAHELCEIICGIQGWDDARLQEYWARECWPDVWRGLNNEKLEWRGSLDLVRIGQEAKYVFGEAAGAPAGFETLNLNAEGQLEAMLEFIALGHFTVPVGLDYETKTVMSDVAVATDLPNSDVDGGCQEACLVRCGDRSCESVKDLYLLPSDRPFTIGRRTDSDAVESSMHVSSDHGCVFRLNGTWYFEDLSSTNGSSVTRAGESFERQPGDGPFRIELEFGDVIGLAGVSWYRFQPYLGNSILPS